MNTSKYDKYPIRNALFCAIASLTLGLTFCALTILIRGRVLLFLGGFCILIICVKLISYGFILLVPPIRRARSGLSRALSLLVLFVLLLNFPAAWFVFQFTIQHISFYTITLVNESPWAITRCKLYSEVGKSAGDYYYEQDFETIPPGAKAAAIWNARDEEGVRFEGTWNDRVIETGVTGYTLWHDPLDFEIYFREDGTVLSNDRKLHLIEKPSL